MWVSDGWRTSSLCSEARLRVKNEDEAKKKQQTNEPTVDTSPTLIALSLVLQSAPGSRLCQPVEMTASWPTCTASQQRLPSSASILP